MDFMVQRLQSINPSTSVVLSVSDDGSTAASWRHGPSNHTLLPIYVHAACKAEARNHHQAAESAFHHRRKRQLSPNEPGRISARVAPFHSGTHRRRSLVRSNGFRDNRKTRRALRSDSREKQTLLLPGGEAAPGGKMLNLLAESVVQKCEMHALNLRVQCDSQWPMSLAVAGIPATGSVRPVSKADPHLELANGSNRVDPEQKRA